MSKRITKEQLRKIEKGARRQIWIESGRPFFKSAIHIDLKKESSLKACRQPLEEYLEDESSSPNNPPLQPQVSQEFPLLMQEERESQDQEETEALEEENAQGKACWPHQDGE